MCGIAGYVSFIKSPKRADVLKMVDQIAYRGPDQTGSYTDKNAAFGINRLSIVDLTTGDQPITNEDRSVIVVFNGEVYNFKELRQSLQKAGHRFKSQSDTEILVHLYEEYGTKMAKYINGMFAFAIWDKNNQQLFLCRDQAGIKPLYFWYQNRSLIFGSEIKAILKHPFVAKKINPKALELYFYFGYIPSNSTVFKNIYKLPAGTGLSFSNKGLQTTRWWTVKSDLNQDNLESLLTDAVSLQSFADVPVGVFISGGIDSSLISFYLNKINPKKVKSFSISFKEKSFDESVFAKIVAKQLKTQHFEENFSAQDMIQLFDEISEKLDEPVADPSLFPAYKLSKLASQHVKVVLSGDGGDELFGGYPTYQGHILAKILKLFPQITLDQLANFLKLWPVSFDSYPKTEVLYRFLSGLKFADYQRHLSWMSLNQWETTPLKLPQKLTTISSDITTQMRWLDFNTYLPDDALFKVDRASMYNSLEVRVPFLDPRIIQYAFNTRRSHVDLFRTKKLLRQLAKNKFPRVIVERKKKGFNIPLGKWIYDELADFVFEQLQNPQLLDFIDRKTIMHYWQEHKNKKRNHGKVLWMLVMFSGWLKRWA